MIVIITFKEDKIEYVSHGINIDTGANMYLPQIPVQRAIQEWKLVNYEGLGWCL